MVKQKVFLTGSTSYVGTKFIELYGKKHDILGLARTDKKHPIDLLDFDEITKFYNEFNPDFVIHLAADIGRDTTTSEKITKTNPAITNHLIELALPKHTPFIFTSTEAVYGGKEAVGDYIEDDPYQPRNTYGESKVISEKKLMASGLPYLITRGHRHVGFSKNFNKEKWFTDLINELLTRKVVHLDSIKLFKPVLINNVCDIFDHYITHDSDKQIILNMGVDKSMTYYDLIVDVAKSIGISLDLIKPDGEETGWPRNSSLSVKKARELGYPYVDYEQMLDIIKNDFKVSR